MLMESGVKDAVPAGRKYKPIPRQAGDPSQEESSIPHTYSTSSLKTDVETQRCQPLWLAG